MSHHIQYISSFSVGNSASKYVLNVGGYSGNAGDSLSEHNGRKFTTKDQDNDKRHGITVRLLPMVDGGTTHVLILNSMESIW